MSQQKTTVVTVALALAVVSALGLLAGLMGVFRSNAERDLHKAVYSPPTADVIAAKQAAAAAEVADMPEGDDKIRALARAEREQGLKTWENCWNALSDEAKTATSLAVLTLLLAAAVQLFKPRRGW